MRRSPRFGAHMPHRRAAGRMLAQRHALSLTRSLLARSSSSSLARRRSQFEERLAAAKKSPTLLFPRGAHESNAQWKVRLGFAAKCKRTILPRSSDEPERGFRDRCEAQLSCMKVMHPYDPKREDEKSFYRRIEANKERTAFAFEPGDTKAINGVLGEEKQKKKAEADGSTPAPAAADDLAKQMAEMAKVREAEDAAEAAAAAKEEEGKAKAAEEAAEAERVEARIADMKKKQQVRAAGVRPVGTAPVGTAPVGTAPVGTAPVGHSARRAECPWAQRPAGPCLRARGHGACGQSARGSRPLSARHALRSPPFAARHLRGSQEMQEAKEREEKEAAKSFDVERIAINQIGFMPLKKLLMERGVPKEQVSTRGPAGECECRRHAAVPLPSQWRACLTLCMLRIDDVSHVHCVYLLELMVQ